MSAVVKAQPAFERMREADIDEVLCIERAVYEFPWTWGNFSDSMRAGYSCWVYREQGRVLGYCVMMIGAGEAHLLNLCIGLSFQRQGRGRRLLAHALSVAAQQSSRLLFLEVRPSNAAARELYAQYGFRQIGVRKGYYPAAEGREDALVLALDLP